MKQIEIWKKDIQDGYVFPNLQSERIITEHPLSTHRAGENGVSSNALWSSKNKTSLLSYIWVYAT